MFINADSAKYYKSPMLKADVFDLVQLVRKLGWEPVTPLGTDIADIMGQALKCDAVLSVYLCDWTRAFQNTINVTAMRGTIYFDLRDIPNLLNS